MISFKDVKREYLLGESIWTFGPVDIEIPSNESVCILGSSGSGKSTLLHLLGGLDFVSSGEIIYDNEIISSFSSAQQNAYRKEKLGFIFQDFYLFPELTVFENIALALTIHGKNSKNENKELVEKVLKNVGLEEKAHSFPHQLSGGQKQRTAIARAIIHSPKMLLADEPTGSLDSKTGKRIVKLLFEIHTQNNMGFWCVTHDQALANKFDIILTADNGKISRQK